MKKIKLDILGLTYSQTQSGAYTLVLGESKGKRRLSVIIGGFEAQAIAIELERMTPNRPLTHDLFKNFGLAFGITITEVIIYNLVEGVFYAKLICVSDSKTIELDTRTSDAIAIAVRFQCPIYTFEFILSTAGILFEEDGRLGDGSEEPEADEQSDNAAEEGDLLSRLSIEQLNELLDKALAEEQYEKASEIRDELNNRKKAQ